MNILAINTYGDEVEASAEYCKTEEIGLEITAFAFPRNLDGNIDLLVNRHKDAVFGIPTLISHGPFLDLIATSRDPAILAVTKQRHKDALDAAIEIGVSYYVAHTNFTPLIRDTSYLKNWTRRMLDFWLPFAEEAGKNNIIICLENLWEPYPDIQAELINSGKHPNLRASFDNGHALVFSEMSSSSWIEALGDTLAHCHLHDNSGQIDEHKPVGEGKENWPELLKTLADHSPQAVLVAESDLLEKNKLSVTNLRSYLHQAE